MKRKLFILIGLFLLTAGCHHGGIAGGEDSAPRISKEQAKDLLSDPGAVVLDARTAASWSGSDRKIKGAVRVDPHEVRSWAGNYPKDKKLIVYCS